MTPKKVLSLRGFDLGDPSPVAADPALESSASTHHAVPPREQEEESARLPWSEKQEPAIRNHTSVSWLVYKPN